MFRSIVITLGLVIFSLTLAGCRSAAKPESNMAAEVVATPMPTATPIPTPKVPNSQAELLDKQHSTTASPIGKFDFKNHTYQLPRGWQNPDGTDEITLKDGKVAPINSNTNEKADDEEKAATSSDRRIGMSFVTTKYFDVTGDGQDDAVIVLKIETGGSAVPQVAYVFEWKGGRPELIWPFRTGDRADGGLKNLKAENGELVVELYGQDRYLLGQIETSRIDGDIEQLCCPTHFTRTRYKWNGKNFLMDKERLTFSISNPNSPIGDNIADKPNPPKTKK